MNKDTIRNLLEEAGKILADRKQETQSGKCFNCVDICGVGTIETRHTEIIAALLDPQGNHGFGAESLKVFFRQCNLPEFADNCEDCRVQTEVKIPGRRPDIVIRGKDLCVVIENKTNTSDHYMQLADYRDWIKDQKVTYKALLYLTYEGYKASDTHIKEGEYQSISYSKTICNWLRECAGMQATPAADFCKQYANFIKENIMEGSVMSTREEIKAILDSPEKIKAAEELAIVVEDVKNQKYIDLFNEWAEKSGKKVWRSLDSGKTYAGFSLEIEGDDELVFGFSFDASGFRNFAYGLTWKDGKERLAGEIEKYKKISLTGCNSWWAYSKYFPAEYRNPGENLDFLFDRKEELFNAMDGAVNEMESLLSSIK